MFLRITRTHTHLNRYTHTYTNTEGKQFRTVCPCHVGYSFIITKATGCWGEALISVLLQSCITITSSTGETSPRE